MVIIFKTQTSQEIFSMSSANNENNLFLKIFKINNDHMIDINSCNYHVINGFTIQQLYIGDKNPNPNPKNYNNGGNCGNSAGGGMTG